MSQPNTIPTSYLSRCTENVSPNGALHLHAQGVLLKVATGVTMIALPILLAGAYAAAFVVCGVIGIIAVGVTTLLLKKQIVSYFASHAENLWSLSEKTRKEANKCAETQKHYADLSNRDVSQIQQDLSERKIDWKTLSIIDQPEALKNLNPILAEAKYFDAKIEKHLELRNEIVQKINKIKQEQIEIDKQLSSKNLCKEQIDALLKRDHEIRIKELHPLKESKMFRKALRSEEKALNIKIQAAFTNAVLRQGDYKGSLETIGSPTPRGFQSYVELSKYREKLLNAINSDAGDKPLFTFKNGSIAPLTHKDVKRLSIPDLAQRLAVAMV